MDLVHLGYQTVKDIPQWHHMFSSMSSSLGKLDFVSGIEKH